MSRQSRFAIASTLAFAIISSTAALSPSNAYTFNVLYSFCSLASCADGGSPQGPALRSGNKLYGTTVDGGTYDSGVIYRFNPSTLSFAVIYSFCNTGTCAYNPMGNLIIDTNGNLYGVARQGGANNGGEVYELVKPVGSGGWTYVALYDFCSAGSCADGSTPIDGLTYAGAGSGTAYNGTALLYGITSSGGSSNKGVVFALHLGIGGTWSERVLHSFSGASSDGDDPTTHPFVDTSNNLWGVTQTGGTDSEGTAYELSPISNPWSGPWTEKIVFNFCWSGVSGTSCPAGSSPVGMLMDANGDLVGVTHLGGTGTSGLSEGGGLLFKLTVGSSCTEGGTATFLCMTVLYNFCSVANCADGQVPSAVPFIDSSGNIFGVTALGGTGTLPPTTGGTVFEFNTSQSVLYDFCSVSGCPDGRQPEASLISDSSGDLLGTTMWTGGANEAGVIYELTP
jgi:uncharacterized repeat protein (TIGR03803 family)